MRDGQVTLTGDVPGPAAREDELSSRGHVEVWTHSLLNAAKNESIPGRAMRICGQQPATLSQAQKCSPRAQGAHGHSLGKGELLRTFPKLGDVK